MRINDTTKCIYAGYAYQWYKYTTYACMKRVHMCHRTTSELPWVGQWYCRSSTLHQGDWRKEKQQIGSRLPISHHRQWSHWKIHTSLHECKQKITTEKIVFNTCLDYNCGYSYRCWLDELPAADSWRSTPTTVVNCIWQPVQLRQFGSSGGPPSTILQYTGVSAENNCSSS